MSSGPGALLVDVAERSDFASLMSAITEAVRTWVGAGPVFLATADPVTGFFTGTFAFDIPEDAAAAFFAIEMAGQDVVSFEALSTAPTPLGALFAATGSAPEISRRWRDVISPLGWGDELRAAIRVHGSTWGYLCVHREAGERPFAARELAQLHALLPAIGTAMRQATAAPRAPGRFETGVVIVDQRCRAAGVTGGAAAWLDEMGPSVSGGLPLILAGLARRVYNSGLPVSATVTTRSGRVGLVEAALLRGDGESQVVVVIGEAPAELHLERLAIASGLTMREREIVSCAVAGMSTRAIADELSISPGTVQAHLTSVFAKTGVRSRRDLISRLSR